METIPQTDAASAPSKTQDLLYAVKKQMGGLPKIFATMAQSPAGRSGYLGVAGALAARNLSNVNRKQIARRWEVTQCGGVILRLLVNSLG